MSISFVPAVLCSPRNQWRVASTPHTGVCVRMVERMRCPLLESDCEHRHAVANPTGIKGALPEPNSHHPQQSPTSSILVAFKYTNIHTQYRPHCSVCPVNFVCPCVCRCSRCIHILATQSMSITQSHFSPCPEFLLEMLSTREDIQQMMQQMRAKDDIAERLRELLSALSADVHST